MEKIGLIPMTRELCRECYREFENDPMVFMDNFVTYEYSEARADAYFDKQQAKGRLYFAIMADSAPVGELILKDIDSIKHECTLSIHLRNDSVKGRGYGIEAERLALEYAFTYLGMNAVNADTIIKNTRSRHVLEKLGFSYLGREGDFDRFRFARGDYYKGKADND